MKRAAAIVTLLAAMAAAPAARADAIDGEWCSGKGLSLMIAGPRIRLPSGKEIEGHYGRHEFAFEAPAGEKNAGDLIFLQLISEEEMFYRAIRNGTPAEPELWRRCNVTS